MRPEDAHIFFLSQLRFLAWVARRTGFHTSREAAKDAPEANDQNPWLVLAAMGFLLFFACGALAHAAFSLKEAGQQTALLPKVTNVQLAQAK